MVEKLADQLLVQLNGLQEDINKLKRLKENVVKNIRISKTRKKELTSSYDRRIRELTANIEDKYEALRR